MAQFDYTELLAEGGAAEEGLRHEIDAVLEKHPSSKEMHATLGVGLYTRGRDAEAVEHLRHLCDARDFAPVSDAEVVARRLPGPVAADVAFVEEMRRDIARSWGRGFAHRERHEALRHEGGHRHLL